MTKLILSALIRPRRDGVEAAVAEFPDIKESSLTIGFALVRLREAIWRRMQWTKVDTSCSGEPLSPVPQKPTSADFAVPIEVDVAQPPAAGPQPT
jgi:hypothetical protein